MSDSNDLTEKIKDNVFLLSTFEVGYVDNYDKTLQLFKNNTTKNKYITSEACFGLKYPWWLRTPIVEDSHCICFIDEHGLLGNTNACYGNMGVRPACVISDYTPIKEKKNGDYKFDWSPFKFNWKKQLDKYSIEEIIDWFNQTQIVSN